MVQIVWRWRWGWPRPATSESKRLSRSAAAMFIVHPSSVRCPVRTSSIGLSASFSTLSLTDEFVERWTATRLGTGRGRRVDPRLPSQLVVWPESKSGVRSWCRLGRTQWHRPGVRSWLREMPATGCLVVGRLREQPLARPCELKRPRRGPRRSAVLRVREESTNSSSWLFSNFTPMCSNQNSASLGLAERTNRTAGRHVLFSTLHAHSP